MTLGPRRNRLQRMHKLDTDAMARLLFLVLRLFETNSSRGTGVTGGRRSSSSNSKRHCLASARRQTAKILACFYAWAVPDASRFECLAALTGWSDCQER